MSLKVQNCLVDNFLLHRVCVNVYSVHKFKYPTEMCIKINLRVDF